MKERTFTTNDFWALDKGIAEKSLYQFLKQAWPQFDPSEFVDGWHLGAVCDHLEAVSSGQIRRLLINVPPRTAKTSAVSIAWPVWTWAQTPNKDNPLKGPGVRFLCASYGATKAQQDAVTSRRLIASPWFQERWGNSCVIEKTRDNQEQYDTTAGGSRISTGIPESLGKGGIIKIVDDPHKTSEVESKEVISSQLRAYDEVWRTRSNDPQQGAEVIIMQRLGENDLSGHLLTKDFDSIVHLFLPMRFESDRRCVTVIGFEDPRKRDGQLLWPQRFNEEWAKQQEIDMGSYSWAGQMQQRPEPRGGGIIKREWWQPWENDKFPECTYKIAVLDSALTEKPGNDPSALVVLGVWTDPLTGFQQVMLMHAWQAWLQLRELTKKVGETCDKFLIDRVPGRGFHGRLLIENRTIGQPIHDELRKSWPGRDWGINLIEATRATGGKEARAESITPLFEDGIVWAPDRPWSTSVIDECSLFPRGRYDNQVDCVVHGLRWLRDSGKLSRKVEQRQAEAAREKSVGRSDRKALYPV